MTTGAAKRDLIVVGASAGGVEALREMVAGLPADLPAAVMVVLHLPAGGTSVLARILDRSGPLPAVVARSGVVPRPGTIYTAPPDHHLMVADGALVLSHGPTENGHRPAVDVLFRSAAIAAGPRVVGVVLSGALDDGAAGVVAIRSRGGAVVVQDPADALYSGMPDSALRNVDADRVLPAAEMGTALAELTRERVEAGSAHPPPEQLVRENDIVLNGVGATERSLGSPSRYSCPDCSGVLNEVEPLRYRCQVGHAWSAEALAQAQDDALDKALWTALRGLNEKTSLAVLMRDRAVEHDQPARVAHYDGQMAETASAADTLRRFLMSRADPPVARGARQ